jgi:tryptophan-rich sensory protein
MRIRTLAATACMSAAAAVVGSIGTTSDSAWYRSLTKPDWQPPSVAFPLVWTPLYALIAWGSARMLDAERDPAARRRLWALLGTNLVANAGWCWAFFTAESPEAGVVVIVGLNGLNVALLNEARKRDRAAALMLAPYAAWTLFATALNAEILRLNA